MSEPTNKKKKWKESIALIAFLLVIGICGFWGVSQWERIPHIYSYGDGMRIKQENVVQAKNNEDAETEDDKDNQAENKETPTPAPKQTPTEADDGEELPDSTPKQEENPDNRREDPVATSDAEGEGDASNDDGEQAQEGSNGGTENNGDGGQSPVIGPQDGQEGEESTEETPDVGEVPKASPTPTPTPKPTPTKSPKPEETEKADEVVALQCSWPDKDSLKYGESIPKNTIVVKAEYASGKVATLNAGDYIIIGLKNDSLGRHTMTIIYQGINYQMDYTVGNFLKSISYNWSTKDRCYYNEDVTPEITIKVYMADGSVEEVKEGFTISGINTKDTSGEQTFTISYMGLSVTGTCRFYDLEYIVVEKYYDGDTLMDEVTTTKINKSYDQKRIQKVDGETKMHNGTEYALKDLKLTVDGVSKKTPYVIEERDFKVVIEKIYQK